MPTQHTVFLGEHLHALLACSAPKMHVRSVCGKVGKWLGGGGGGQWVGRRRRKRGDTNTGRGFF